MPEWSKGADLRSARRLSAWVQTPQIPYYALSCICHCIEHNTFCTISHDPERSQTPSFANALLVERYITITTKLIKLFTSSCEMLHIHAYVARVFFSTNDFHCNYFSYVAPRYYTNTLHQSGVLCHSCFWHRRASNRTTHDLMVMCVMDTKPSNGALSVDMAI